jgi:transposase InsO family protein
MKALQEQGYRIGDLCAAFGVSRSGYHRARTAAPSARACKDAQIEAELREVHQQSRGTYGRPRLMIALRRRGQRHSAKRIARLMRTCGLRGVRRGRFRPQTTEEAEGNSGGWRMGEQRAGTRTRSHPTGSGIRLHLPRRTRSGSRT